VGDRLDPGEEPLALAPAGEHQGKVLVADTELGSSSVVRPTTCPQSAFGVEEAARYQRVGSDPIEDIDVDLHAALLRRLRALIAS